MRINRTASFLGIFSSVMLFSWGAHRVAAHDTWVETNTSIIRAGDAVYIDLKLGNHGNDHRDFKLASKVNLASSTLQVRLPHGHKLDIKDKLIDVGYAPQEGYWTAKFTGGAAGTYTVCHRFDQVLNHGRAIRSIKSGKTFFLAGLYLDKLKDDSESWKEPLGDPLEIVPVSHPVLFTGPGMPVQVQVLYKKKPLPESRVSFIPEDVTLSEGMDPVYERMTDANGIASFTPKTGCRLLIVTHQRDDQEKSTEYEFTSYSATLQMLIPEICPCCQ